MEIKKIGKVYARNKKGTNYYSFRFSYTDELGRRKHIEKGGKYKTEKEAIVAGESYKLDFIADIKANPRKLEISKKDSRMNNVFNLYLEKMKSRREYLTIKKYKSVYNSHLKNQFGNIKIDDIEIYDFEDYLESIKNSCARSYIANIVTVINIILTFAYERNFTTKLKKVKIRDLNITPNKKDKRIHDKKFLDKLEKRLESTNVISIFKICRHLGLRKGEACGLLWDDIDFVNNTIYINKQLSEGKNGLVLKKTKTPSSIRTVYMDKQLRAYLLKIKKEQEYRKNKMGVNYKNKEIPFINISGEVKILKQPDFVNRKKDGTYQNPTSTSVITRICKKEFGVEFIMHDLRHTLSTELLENAKSPSIITALSRHLGHSSPKVTLDNYIHESKNSKNELSIALESRFSK